MSTQTTPIEKKNKNNNLIFAFIDQNNGSTLTPINGTNQWLVSWLVTDTPRLLKDVIDRGIFQSGIERFSIQCLKPNPKVITSTNWKILNNTKDQSEFEQYSWQVPSVRNLVRAIEAWLSWFCFSLVEKKWREFGNLLATLNWKPRYSEDVGQFNYYIHSWPF